MEDKVTLRFEDTERISKYSKIVDNEGSQADICKLNFSELR